MLLAHKRRHLVITFNFKPFLLMYVRITFLIMPKSRFPTAHSRHLSSTLQKEKRELGKGRSTDTSLVPTANHYEDEPEYAQLIIKIKPF